jgi:hypothetical protein
LISYAKALNLLKASSCDGDGVSIIAGLVLGKEQHPDMGSEAETQICFSLQLVLHLSPLKFRPSQTLRVLQ